MKLYSYYCVFPLDWEFCFLSVSEYKTKLEEKYYQNKHVSGNLSEVYSLIDETLVEAEKDFKYHLKGSTTLRCPPMIFPIPRGGNSHVASFCIVLKRDEDGDTFVYSPVPLTYLES